MSTDAFDDLDRALASGMSALAPDVASADAALAELRPRFERARTRRRVAFASGALALVGVLGTVAAFAAPGKARSHVRVAVPPSLPTTTVPESTTTHRATSTTRGSTTTTTPSTIATAVPPPASTSRTTAPAPVFSIPPAAAPVVTAGTTPSTAARTTTTAPVDTKTYQSGGGSIVVRLSNGSLALLDVSPAPGYSADIRDQGPDRVDVRFDNGNAESRIILHVSGGRVVQSNVVHR